MEPTLKTADVRRELEKFEQVFNRVEREVLARMDRESQVWRAVNALGGKFKGRMKGVMLFSVPGPVPLKPGWTLDGTELRVEISPPLDVTMSETKGARDDRSDTSGENRS